MRGPVGRGLCTSRLRSRWRSPRLSFAVRRGWWWGGIVDAGQRRLPARLHRLRVAATLTYRFAVQAAPDRAVTWAGRSPGAHVDRLGHERRRRAVGAPHHGRPGDGLSAHRERSMDNRRGGPTVPFLLQQPGPQSAPRRPSCVTRSRHAIIDCGQHDKEVAFTRAPSPGIASFRSKGIRCTTARRASYAFPP